MLKKHSLFFLTKEIITSDHVLLVNDASVVPENSGHAFSSGRLGLRFFLSGRCAMTICKSLAFQFQVLVMHPTLVP
jgi:hypothetical protein